MSAANHPSSIEETISACGTQLELNSCITSEQASNLADLLKSVADPTRLRILDLIERQSESVCVCDISSQFSQHQPTISHHLRILRDVGLVEIEKHGVWVYYRATALGVSVLQAARSLF